MARRHPVIDDALRLLPDLVAAGPVSGTELAARVGMSASRLTHLFTQQVGIPLRRYVLWSRLRIAITRVRAGDDLTGAAHSAGFADSAHLTRTTRDMFRPCALGAEPTRVLGPRQRRTGLTPVTRHIRPQRFASAHGVGLGVGRLRIVRAPDSKPSPG
jgi:AraC-like DNA-binding protein